MVAPTRTPQARGVKCDLCKKILALATWLDQTKLAKEVEEAQTVLNLIQQHQLKECPCIPKNIENLLVGSTHFEIHRLAAKRLDAQIYKKQYDCFMEAKQRIHNESLKNRNQILNDCHDSSKKSRFKVYTGYNDQKHCERSKQQLKHICRAVDYWRIAMEDPTNPFNSKLALRLGLTHHVIYACYLFKYYKVFDYQLVTANLLLNLFKSIEGVTANAVLHANYLVIKTLIDCEQIQLARQYLKQATKCNSYRDKSNYESILLTCAKFELMLYEGLDVNTCLDELAELVIIQAEDKLQHYYARTLAMSLIIKYIHYNPSKSDNCFEFFHTYRYICAIIRRCYEDSFELVLAEKDLHKQDTKCSKGYQILDHSWIRFAICDFVYNAFDLLVEFYSRAGMPENLELLYNGLNLVAFRTGSCFWQSRIVAIGARLDLLCDKYEHARSKLDVLSRVFGYTSEPFLMNLLRIESEVTLMSIIDQEESELKQDVIVDLLKRIETCKDSLADKLFQIELYDCKSGTNFKLVNNHSKETNIIVANGCLGNLSLKIMKIGISSLLKYGRLTEAQELFSSLTKQLVSSGQKLLEYYATQMLIETLVQFADIEKTEKIFLEFLSSSNNGFLDMGDRASSLNLQLSSLTLSSDADKAGDLELKSSMCSSYSGKCKSTKVSKINISRRSKRKGVYQVAEKSEENFADSTQVFKFIDLFDTLENFLNLTKEQILISYLRNSEPNPDFSLNRKAHELLFCLRFSETSVNHDQAIYHFIESATANTMRYRWMMLEEQSISPYDSTKSESSSNEISSMTKQLSFCSSTINADKACRSILRSIPDDNRIIQFKYILNKSDSLEHLICCCLEGSSFEPLYFHSRRPITTDVMFEESRANKNDETSLPDKISKKIEESRESLLMNNNRSQKRQQIETDIGIILHDAENDLLGPFRFIMCGKILDVSYNNFITKLMEELQSIMRDYICTSNIALKWFLENAPLLSRDEFCQFVSAIFNCSASTFECRDCFNKWLKSIEMYMIDHASVMSKRSFLQTLSRGQLGIILDKTLELIPFESLPTVMETKQGIFRVPSLRIFSILIGRQNSPIQVDSKRVAYILDPACNLSKTREFFRSKLKRNETWEGVIGQAPQPDQLEGWLSTMQVYLFIGHGAGTIYYNKLKRGRGVGYLAKIRSTSVVMGCSSGRLQAEGPRLESFGISWLFIFRGAPCYVGLLWDVTDTDIDKYLDALLNFWMPGVWNLNNSVENGGDNRVCSVARAITEASSRARQVCQLKFLVGSAPVVYGLPVWSKQ